MAELPTGTVTLLFSDIEGSTRLLQRLGDRYPDALAAQRRLLRAAFAQHGGLEVDSQGDAFFAVFVRAGQALAAAIEAQRTLQAATWPEGHAVRVRIGLHTGEPQRTPEGYAGIDVHRAARICSAAHGGQVLCSEAAAIHVRQGLPAGVHLRDLGEHRLKDLVHPEHLYQLECAELPRSFPPPQSLSSRALNLPLPPTSLIGRERELSEIIRLLAETRLLTVTGAGGTGKTRLAIEAARGLERAFNDGICFVALAPLSDPDIVASAIARAIGIEDTDRAPQQHLVEFLHNRELLLVLDNFEHLLPAAPLVASLQSDCPRLAMLVTSRTLLRLSGEQVYPLSPLEIPTSPLAPLDRVARCEAVQLFVARARALNPAFALSADNASAVAAICRRVDGLPLAIELAAARTRLLPPQALLARLEHRLPVLAGGALDLPARQQTLRDAIAWSYDLLTEDEQRFFRRLAVFAGSWALEAAEAITSVEEPQPFDVLDLLASLADKSLVKREETADGEPRFSMLETVREFAWERLVASGEVEHMRRLHATYLLGLPADDRALPASEVYSLWRRLDADLDNLRAALAWCAELPERRQSGLRLAVALNGFWESRGHWAEGRSWLERFLEPAGGADAELLTRALMAAGDLATFQGDAPAARAYLERSLEFWRGRPAGPALAMCLRYLARVENDPAAARALCAEALAIATRLQLDHEMAMDHNILGTISLREGDLAGARVHAIEGLAIARGRERSLGVAVLLNVLAPIALAEDNVDEAQALFDEGLSSARALGDRKTAGWHLAGLAAVAMKRREEALAESLANEALELFRLTGNRQDIARTLSLLALLQQRRRDPAAALSLYMECLALRQMAGNPRTFATSILRLAADSEWFPSAWAEEAAAATIARLAESEIQKERPDRAARLMGIATVVRRITQRPPSDTFRRRLVHLREQLRNVLSDDGFATAFEAGRALPVQQAVEEAVSLLGAEAESDSVSSPQPDQTPGFPNELTTREVEIVRLIASGMSNAEIAAGLVVSVRTVERHVENVYGKLGLHGKSARAAVAVYASNRGLLDPELRVPSAGST